MFIINVTHIERGVVLHDTFTAFLLPLATVLTSGSSLKVSTNPHLAFSPQVPGSPKCLAPGHSPSEIRLLILISLALLNCYPNQSGGYVPLRLVKKLLASTGLPPSQSKFQGVQGVNLCMFSFVVISFLMNLGI